MPRDRYSNEVDGSVCLSVPRKLRDIPRGASSLELVSRSTASPITIVDPLAVKRNPVSTFLSAVLHVAILAAILWFTFHVHERVVVPLQAQIPPTVMKLYMPVTAPAPKTMGGGGGGGERSVVEASKGHLPHIVKSPVTAPVQLLKVDHPKLAAAPVVAIPKIIRMPQNTSMPNLGMPRSTQIALASQGGGSGSGFGQGSGGGIGSGAGGGLGPGTGGGYGGGVMSVGGGVSAPQLIHKVLPEFTDAARTARYEGTVAIRLIVDSQGNPQDVQVVRHLGMGLDAKAIAAVRQYKFRPAMFHGQPVAVQMVIEVTFQLS